MINETSGFIMVLNDGETYSSLEGCKIVELTAEFYENAEKDGFDIDNAIEDILDDGPNVYLEFRSDPIECDHTSRETIANSVSHANGILCSAQDTMLLDDAEIAELDELTNRIGALVAKLRRA